MNPRTRLTVVMTHPVQYYSPWFRYIHEEASELDLRVLYVSEPAPRQQGTGFDEPFEWDVALREGYCNEVLRPSQPKDRFESESFLGLDAPGIGRAVERGEPHVALLMGWHCLALVRALLACRRRKVPLLYRGDTTSSRRHGALAHGLWRLRTGWLLERFDRYLAVGTRVREHLARFDVPRERIFPSPHAVDNDFFARAAAPYQCSEVRTAERRRLGVAGEDLLVLFVGKLDSNKRVGDAIRALAELRERSFLLVAGSGPLREEHAALASELAVSVVWHGFANQGELGKLYALADCLVLPSESETWGLVVNEAMATGLPCIVSDGVGCAPDLIESGVTGEVYPAGDFRALAAALRRLADEKRAGSRRSTACVAKAGAHSFGAATAGLVDACRSLEARVL